MRFLHCQAVIENFFKKGLESDVKNTKALVKDIVKLLGSDEQISELYEAWHRYKCEIARTYTDEIPDKIPITVKLQSEKS